MKLKQFEACVKHAYGLFESVRASTFCSWGSAADLQLATTLLLNYKILSQ